MKRTTYWNTVAEEWENTCPQPLWRAHSDALYEALLRRWLPRGCAGQVLKTDLFDEAYSAGLFPFLATRAQRVTGVDVSGEVLGAAQARYPDLEAVRADVRALPFPDSCFDVVVSNSTLDHFDALEDLRRSLRELHRVLRPGGQLLLTLDNAANPVVALRNALPFSLLHGLGVLPYYVGVTCGPTQLRALLCEAGFRVSEEEAVLHCPRVLAVKASQLLERYASVDMQKRFLRALMPFEALARWPTRYLTGYYVAVKAVKEET